MKNPFENYQAPSSPQDIFSVEGKKQIVLAKLIRLRQKIAWSLLEGDALQALLEGASDHVVEYDRASFEPFIRFEDDADELDVLGPVVMNALTFAIHQKKASFTGALLIGKEDSQEAPGKANLIIKNKAASF